MAAIFFKQVLQSMWGEEHLLQDGTELLFVFVLEQLAIQGPWILKIFKCRPSGLNFVIRVIFNIKKKHLSIFVCYVSGHICIGPFFGPIRPWDVPSLLFSEATKRGKS